MIHSKEILAGLEKIRSNSPLVHNITNYVVMNSTANALLSVGASPVMAHAVDEVEDMVVIASALVINMGTLSEKWVEAMLKAGKKAKDKGIPVVFDPVGAGATPYRTTTAETIINLCKPSIIRGNASEIMALCDTRIKTKGVDSTISADSAIDSARFLAGETGAVIVISGETDYIVDGEKMALVKNGSSLMPKVTGMGCTATAIIGAFAGIGEDLFSATVMAMAVMGIAGEIAAEKSEGPGSMQLNFLDELHNLSAESVHSRLKLEYETF
jgi:hydroxyethylthiazole kinase